MSFKETLMDRERDLDNHRNNTMYYNQLLRENKTKSKTQRSSYETTSFAQKKVDFSDYLPIIVGYEGIFYTFYFIAIPYLIGATFLFFAVAGGKLEHFMLLEFSAFLVVWMIGYEVVAALILIAILISFFKHDSKQGSRR
jgi:hypothetical protein